MPAEDALDRGFRSGSDFVERMPLSAGMLGGHIAEIVSDLGPMDPGSRSVFYHRRMVE